MKFLIHWSLAVTFFKKNALNYFYKQTHKLISLSLDDQFIKQWIKFTNINNNHCFFCWCENRFKTSQDYKKEDNYLWHLISKCSNLNKIISSFFVLLFLIYFLSVENKMLHIIDACFTLLPSFLTAFIVCKSTSVIHPSPLVFLL